MLAITVLVFLAVTCALSAAVLWLTPSRTELRLMAGRPTPDASGWSETIARVAEPLSRLSTPGGDWESSPLRLRFLNAGIRGPQAPVLYYGAKTVLPLAMAALTFAMLAWCGLGAPSLRRLSAATQPS